METENNTLDKELIRDLYLSLDNEGDFHTLIVPVYKSAEKKIAKDQYDSEKFIQAIQSRVGIFQLHGPLHFSYNRKFFPLIGKKVRVEVAKLFEEYFLAEVEAGNSWIPKDVG